MKAAVIFGLLALLVAGGVVFFLAGSRSNNAVAPDSENLEAAALEEKLSASEAERLEMREAMAKLEERNRELEEAAKEATQAAEAANVETGEPVEDETEEETAQRRRSLDEIRETIKNNPNASAQLKALAELMYADFLNSIELNPELKAELRQLLTESLIESISLNQFALAEGDVPWSEVRGWELNERAYLDAKLKELLPQDAYEQWTDYLQDIDAHQLEGNLRNQIRAVASGLTPESFDLALQVAVEEFRAQQMLLEQSNQPFTQSENVYYQLRAMESMRKRLAALLPPSQMAELENWLTMANRLLSAQLPDED